MTTIYREFDCNTRQLKILNPTVTGGIRGDDNSLKIVFIYTNDTYLEDKKPYIVFDIVDSDTNNLYTFSEDTTPRFDGYTFTVPAELLQKKGVNNGYVHFQLGFIGLTDDIGDVVFEQSQIDLIEYTAANTLILRDSLSSDLSQAPSYYAWAEYYKEHGLLDSIEKEETENGCIVRFKTYTGEVIEVPFYYVKLNSDGEIADTIFPHITVTETVEAKAELDGAIAEKLLKLTTDPYYGSYTISDLSGYTQTVYYITRPTANGADTTYYVKVEETVERDGLLFDETNWYESDREGNIKEKDVEVIIRPESVGLNGNTVPAVTETHKQKIPAEFGTGEMEKLEASEGVEDVQYGYYIANFGGDKVPVFYVINDSGYAYYTYRQKVDDLGTITESKIWYKCDENGVVKINTVITPTTEILFEDKQNKIYQWGELNQSVSTQYPSAKLVWDTFRAVGRSDDKIIPYTYVNGEAITGNYPVQGGAVADALENEATTRRAQDRAQLKAISELNETVEQITTLIGGIGDDSSDADNTHSAQIADLTARVTAIETTNDNQDTALNDALENVSKTEERMTKYIQDQVEYYITDDTSELHTSMERTSNALNQQLTSTANSLYQSMNTLKNEVVGNVTSSITTLQTKTSTLENITANQEKEISDLGTSFTRLSDSLNSMSDNLSIDFTKVDLVTVDKTTGKIAEDLLPDTAITEFFGPVSSYSNLASVTRKKTVATVTKVPEYVKKTQIKEVTTITKENRYALYECDTPYEFTIGDKDYTIEKEIYSIAEDGTLSIAYRLCPQFNGTSYYFFDGTVSGGTAVPKYIASQTYAVSPAYTIFEGNTSVAKYSVTTEVVSSENVAVRNEDGSIKKDENDVPITEVKHVYRYKVSAYTNGVDKYIGVPAKAEALFDRDGKVATLTDLGTGSGDATITRFYEEVKTVTEETIELDEKVPKTDENGLIVYQMVDDVRRLEGTAIKYLVYKGNLTVKEKNEAREIVMIQENEDVLYLTPKLIKDYDGSDVIPTEEKSQVVQMGSGTKSIKMAAVTSIVGKSPYTLYPFYVLDPVTENKYTIRQTEKTTVTYVESEVSPQRGDMCIVKGSIEPTEDGTYLLGRSDVDGHTYSSVLAHWVKLESPQAYWGQITGNPSSNNVNSGLTGTIADQPDLMAALNAKEDKFIVGGGLETTTDEDDDTVIGHHENFTSDLLVGAKSNSINVLSLNLDKYGHVTNKKETVIYPPTTIGQYSEDESGSDYWGVSKDNNGKNVCQWITPETEVTQASRSLVTSAGVWKAINEARSDMGNIIATKVDKKQNKLIFKQLTLPPGNWSDVSGAWVHTLYTGDETIKDGANIMLTFDTPYLQNAINWRVTMHPTTPIPADGQLRFYATEQPTDAIKVNVLIIN